MKENQIIIKNEFDLQNLAEKILKTSVEFFANHHKATVLALRGDLGSGKTTFTKNLARILNIKENVSSPTFVIQKEFEIPAGHSAALNFKKLIHIDSYRLDLSSELLHLGWHDLLNHRENLIVIEWPEKVADILPKKHIEVKFNHVDETTRCITYKIIENA